MVAKSSKTGYISCNLLCLLFALMKSRCRARNVFAATIPLHHRWATLMVISSPLPSAWAKSELILLKGPVKALSFRPSQPISPNFLKSSPTVTAWA